MRVAVSIVGKRTEHWEGFFTALARNPELELDVAAADISPLAQQWLQELAAAEPRFRFRTLPYLVGEDRTGHMAATIFGAGSWAWLRDRAPDVLHVVGEPAYLSTFQAIRFRNRHWPRVPITHYAAQNVVTRFPYPFPWLERYAYGQISRAFPITPAALDVLRRKGFGGEAQIVPLGVDENRFRPRRSAPPEFTVGFVGRLEPHKGIAQLVDACERAQCRLLLVGDGSLRPWVEGRAAACPGSIELVPWLAHDDLPAALERMSVLALPSVEIVQRNVLPWVRIPLREQFGRVLVEAMAAGVPVIASRVGEMPYVLGEAGTVVPPDDVEALAGAIAALRAQPRLAEELAGAGIRRARRFHWSRIADDVYEAWQTLAVAA